METNTTTSITIMETNTTTSITIWKPTQQPQQESLTQQEAQSWTPQPRYQSRKPTQPQQR